MMLFGHLIIALALAILLGGIFLIAFARPGPWESIPFFFLVVFLVIWAGGIWMTPIGPTVWGVYWLPFLVIGLLFMILLAATSPPSRRTTARSENVEERREERARARLALETFFWALIVGLAVVIAVRYIA